MTTDAENKHRRLVVQTFVAAAITGQVEVFLANLDAITWPGAWREVFTKVTRLPADMIHPSIRREFSRVWCIGTDPQKRIRDSSLIHDLDGDLDMLLSGLRALTAPVPDDEMPSVIFRGQTRLEHDLGMQRIWWSCSPLGAEFYARASIRHYPGTRVILAAFDPGHAIVARRNHEVIVDPRLLGRIEVVAEPRPYTDEEMGADGFPDLLAASILDPTLRVYDMDAGRLAEWLRRRPAVTAARVAA